MSKEDFARAEKLVRDERIENFKKVFAQMIATSDAAYDNSETSRVRRGRATLNYDSEEIRRIVNQGTVEEQTKLSEFFFATNGLYKRIILHYATFLTYSWILAPYCKGYGRYKISDKSVSRSYFDAADFCTTFQIDRKCALFAANILTKGAYYGLVIDNGNDVVILDLPNEYCRSRFKNHQDVDIIEFNLDFFKKIRDEDLRKEILNTYPKIIQKAYRKYALHNGPKWVFIPAEIGIYFCFFEEKPFFLDIIPLLNDLDAYKDLDKQRNIQALKRILVQEIPHDGMKLVFEPQEAEVMHQGVVNMLQNNTDIDVVTSYAKVNLLDMSSRDDEKTEITKVQDLIYASAGMSKELFFATTEAGINYSINNDLALVMILAQRFAHFFSVLLNYKFETKKIKFKLLILPISYYNSADYTSRARELASFGYSFLTPILSTGIDQTNLAALKALENDLLDLDEVLKPLQSSYTQSGKKAGESMDAVKETDYLGEEKDSNSEKDDSAREDNSSDDEQNTDKGGGE